jgi:hypothetical protein
MGRPENAQYTCSHSDCYIIVRAWGSSADIRVPTRGREERTVMPGFLASVNRQTLPAPVTPGSRRESIAWYMWGVVAAATFYVTGFYWDISWHQTIGRDSFLNPAHVTIYLCGVVGGISCAYLIFSTTFGKHAAAQASSIKVWGFRAPLGAFVVAWGGMVMLTSAPFDNWWHNAYGLDAKLNSPPHWILTTGVFAVEIGGMILLAGAMNRGTERMRQKLSWLLLYLGAAVIALPLVLTNNRALQHSAITYAAVSALVPAVLVAMATASRRRWACTIVAAMYTGYVLAFLWILPLFPGSPRLGPVFQDVTHFVPPSFPMLIIVPAFFLDCLLAGWPSGNAWAKSVAAGTVFLVALVAAQWSFADFLMSPYARNRVFGADRLPYFTPASSHLASNQFNHVEKSRLEFWIVMAVALGLAVVGSRLGLASGNWLRRVRR